MQKMIVLKTTCKNFDDILLNRKRFEVLKENQKFEIGDLLIFREFDKYGDFTGREIHARITHISCPASFRDYSVVGFDYCLFYPLSENSAEFVCIVL